LTEQENKKCVMPCVQVERVYPVNAALMLSLLLVLIVLLLYILLSCIGMSLLMPACLPLLFHWIGKQRSILLVY